MNPTEVLKAEHRVIERVLKVLEIAAAKLEAGGEVSPSILEKALDFIQNFADRCHHAKEEDVLFVALEDRGMPKGGGPIAMMLMEHGEGREFVRGLAGAIQRYSSGDKAAAGQIVSNARGYAQLLTQHIWKEDNILYAMADDIVPAEALQGILDKFEDIERERMGEGVHARYHHLVHEMEAEVTA